MAKTSLHELQLARARDLILCEIKKERQKIMARLYELAWLETGATE
jgi:hypothetical protein